MQLLVREYGTSIVSASLGLPSDSSKFFSLFIWNECVYCAIRSAINYQLLSPEPNELIFNKTFSFNVYVVCRPHTKSRYLVYTKLILSMPPNSLYSALLLSQDRRMDWRSRLESFELMPVMNTFAIAMPSFPTIILIIIDWILMTRIGSDSSVMLIRQLSNYSSIRTHSLISLIRLFSISISNFNWLIILVGFSSI